MKMDEMKIDKLKYNKLLYEIAPKHAGAVFEVKTCPVKLVGASIINHIGESARILISCATLGEEFDRLLRRLQLSDLAGALVLDALSGERLEAFCDEQDAKIIKAYNPANETIAIKTRFSPGYGDLPLSVNLDILNVLNAQRRIGLCSSEEFILTPQKSITGITPF